MNVSLQLSVLCLWNSWRKLQERKFQIIAENVSVKDEGTRYREF